MNDPIKDAYRRGSSDGRASLFRPAGCQRPVPLQHDADRIIESLSPDARPGGPSLPPPNLLLEYEQVDPGLKRKIVDQWSGEAQHRQATQTSLLTTKHTAMLAYYAGEKRRQYLLLSVFLGTLVVALASVVLNH